MAESVAASESALGALATFLAVVVALIMPRLDRYKIQEFEKRILINKMNLTSAEELYSLFTERAEKTIALIEKYEFIRGEPGRFRCLPTTYKKNV